MNFFNISADKGKGKRLRLLALLAVLAIGGVVAMNAFAATRPGKPTIKGPHNPTNKTQATFRFHSKGAKKYQCALDHGKFRTCSSPKTFKKISAGRHDFRVRGLDKKGRKSHLAAYHWTVDKKAPVVSSITRGQASPTNQSSLSWTVTFSEPVTGVRAGAFGLDIEHVSGTQPAISSITPVAGSGGRAYTVVVSAAGANGANNGSIELDVAHAGIRDAAGNALAGVPFGGESYAFDTTAPAAPTHLSGPDDPSPQDPNNPMTLDWTAADGGDTVSFRCRIDGGTYQVCGSPASYDNLSVATHNFDVVAVDAAGNQSAPSSYGWTVLAPVQNWTASGDIATSLQPGSDAAKINVAFHNPNSYSLSLQSLAVTVSAVTKAAGAVAGDCDLSNFATSDLSGAAFTLPPGDSSLSSLGVPSANWPTVRMLETGQNQDACKGASITFDYQGVATK